MAKCSTCIRGNMKYPFPLEVGETHGEQCFPAWLLKPFSLTPAGAIASPLQRRRAEQRRPVCPHSGTGQCNIPASFVGVPHRVFTRGTIGAQWSRGLLRPPESLCVCHAPCPASHLVQCNPQTLERKCRPQRKRNGRSLNSNKSTVGPLSAYKTM